MRAGDSRWVVLALFLWGSGCTADRPIAWDYQLDAPLGPAEVLAATIRVGGCAPRDEVAFFGILGARTFQIPPLEGDRDYCFEVAVVNVDTCQAARGARDIIRVDNALESIAVPQTIATYDPVVECPSGSCVPGVGCLTCPATHALCDDNMYCCRLASLCSDPELFDNDCVPIR